MPSIYSNRSIAVLLLSLIAVVIVAYYPSLSVPFYLDDHDSITANPLIHSHNLELLIDSPLRMRFIGYFSLWANYQFGQTDPFGYHIVNIGIHIINSIVVYYFSLLLLRFFNDTSSVRTNNVEHLKLWALIIAALWALHPLNSQAVIYVVQRLASIVVFFYMLTIIFYIRARIATSNVQRIIFSLLTLLSVFAGFHSKQNFVAVFVFLYIWELYTATALVRARLIKVTLFVSIVVLVIAPFVPTFWQMLDGFTRDYNAESRTVYFYTQMPVLWGYLFKFIYPLSLQLDVEVTLESSMSALVLIALCGHVLLLLFAYRIGKLIPMFFIGIVFFYTSHMVESFIIPIKDLAFEHRSYVGNVGLVIALIGLVKYWLEKTSNLHYVKSFVVVGLTLITIGCIVIFQRSILWQNPLAFYANEVKLSPRHARANASYGNELMKLKRYEEAEKYIKKGVDIDLVRGKITASALTSFMTVLYQQQKYQQASHIVMMGLKHIRIPAERSTLLSNLAVGYIYMGYCDFARGLLNTAIELDANNNDAKTNLAYCSGK